MEVTEYHNRIVEYYKVTENAYKDSWDLNNSHAIHYGYRDHKAKSFPQSLRRMNEVMAETATISPNDTVLDAGCGIGGSSIFLAKTIGCRVTGITLSERQVNQATAIAKSKGVSSLVKFEVMNYCETSLPDQTFDIIWGCESICYAEDKKQFINEAFRLLKPGGRLIMADGFVSRFENNSHPVIRKWLNGWQVNYLESPDRMNEFAREAGFSNINYRNISPQTFHSSRRLYRFYYLATLYLWWKKLTFSDHSTAMQRGNIAACRYQYIGMKKKLWEYGLLTALKR